MQHYTRFMVVILLFLGCITSACARRMSAYQTWGEQLNKAPLHGARVDDVSLMLGAPPTRCEPVNDQTSWIGILTNMKQEQPQLTMVMVNGPAFQAGLHAGDIVRSVAGQPVTTSLQLHAALMSNRREGRPLELNTDRGTFSVTPTVPKREQCYWEISAGQIAKSRSSTYASQYGKGTVSGLGSTSYERFFRASCRINNGYVGVCKANWQQ